ncbi:DNA-directed RNA polymerase subunit beta' [Candidatus Acetothermia bacterium]|nr:DNA-directed RNA polymerase subunit beta' [Candidatus Acetothermia bacterium]
MISGDDIRKIKLELASPETVLKWSHGEVTKSETINYRTHKPEQGGLYAEHIFGPENDYECSCGKYKGKKYEGITCEKCSVLVTSSAARRVNFGHISLVSPVVHFWFLKGVSSPLSRLLGIKKKELEQIVYYETESSTESLYIVTTSQSKEIRPGEILYNSEMRILRRLFAFDVEAAIYIENPPQVVASEGGIVKIEERKLTNGEPMIFIVVGSQAYPVSPAVPLLVAEGDEIETDTLLAEMPVDELCSQTAFAMFSAYYGSALRGEAIEENLDSLIFLVTKVKNPAIPLQVGDRVSYLEKRAWERLYPGKIEIYTGAHGVKELLTQLNLVELHNQLTAQMRAETSQGNQRRIVKRLSIVDQLLKSGNRPQNMVLDVLPVLPPFLRPMIQLDGGKFATTDLNDLYRRIINRNNRLKKLISMGAPEVILRNERRMLQESVDALIYNEKKETPICGRDNQPLKSLSERLQGKHGRLRRNLLGRRVDYSGRAVIVVDPTLKLHQCGLPKKIALELFKPFILSRLKETAFSDFDDIKNKALLGELPEVWDILEELVKEHPVLLNRQPTLHRMSIQAFEPLLVDGEAIHIHPLVCPPYNADFDGDQMSVHLPLSVEAISEARNIMAAPLNILSPSNGEPLTVPSQDPIFAFHYMTTVNPNGKGRGKYFKNIDEARRAYEEKIIDLHSEIKIKIDGELIDSTLGRAEINHILPSEIRNYTRLYSRKEIKQLVMECYYRCGKERMAALLDDLKDLGFKYATHAGLTISLKDCLIPPEKEEIVHQSYARVLLVNKMYESGLATEKERSQAVIKVWRQTVDAVEKAAMKNLSCQMFNPLAGIVISGARGGPDQVKQLCGMRGPMAGPSGEIIEMPVISNFREGLDMMEYFISTHGGRKGAADTALKTAESGYLTRRLVDACSDVIVIEEDCGTHQGSEINPFWFSKGDLMVKVADRIYGRVTAEPVIDPRSGEILIAANQWIDKNMAHWLGTLQHEFDLNDKAQVQRAVGMKSVTDIHNPANGRVLMSEDEPFTAHLAEELCRAGFTHIILRPRIVIRSPMTCETEGGICQLCYGFDLSNHQPVALGTAAGVIAAQSIGEPGTQLTMRTFHTGGVAGIDITQGLPRAEELFEARKTMKSAQAAVSSLDGYVSRMLASPAGREIVEITGEERVIRIPSLLLNPDLLHADESKLTEVQNLVVTKSPYEGELFVKDGDGGIEILIINSKKGGQIYRLPKGAIPVVEDGDVVREGIPLTERFTVETVISDSAGVVELNKENDRQLNVVSDDGNLHSYPIAYGARPLVKAGDLVHPGDKLISKSKPMVITAAEAGKVALVDGIILIYTPQVNGLRFPLTTDLTLIKEHGEMVKAGERILQLNLQRSGSVVIEKVEEKEEGLTTVYLRYVSQVEVEQRSVVSVGDKVREGDLLTKGVVPPHILLEASGVRKTRDYLLSEIHKVYKTQGVDLSDKHIEIIIRQILNNVRIISPGDADLLLDSLVSLETFRAEIARITRINAAASRTRQEVLGDTMTPPAKVARDIIAMGRVIAPAGESFTAEILVAAQRAGIAEVIGIRDGKEIVIPLRDLTLPTGERELLRISKAALSAKGWLAAASFLRTTTVLAEAALRGEVDELKGLKPCVIVGKKIPVGTGFKMTIDQDGK